LAERALELDKNLAEAHASLGHTLMHYYLDWKKAGVELERALELSPSYATARMWHATHLAVTGRLEESMAEIRRAVELDPLSMIVLTDEAKELYFRRRYKEAVETYRHSLEVDAQFAIAYKGLAEVHVQLGKYEEAIREIETAISLSRRSIFILDDLGYVYARAGMRREAQNVQEELEKLSREEYVPAYGRAAICVGLGDRLTAMEWLERAFEEKGFLTWIKMDPVFEPLKEEPRFSALISQIGL
jgi:tetratricopeptide (TPR) repeat protein